MDLRITSDTTLNVVISTDMYNYILDEKFALQQSYQQRVADGDTVLQISACRFGMFTDGRLLIDNSGWSLSPLLGIFSLY